MKHLVELKNDSELVLGLTADITTVSIDGIQVYPVDDTIDPIEPQPPVDPERPGEPGTPIEPDTPVEPGEPPVEDKTPPTYKLKEELQHG